MASSDEVLAFIAAYIDKWGCPPSVREVCRGVGLSSTSSVKFHLRVLQKQGRLTWVPNRHRTLRIVKDSDAGG